MGFFSRLPADTLRPGARVLDVGSGDGRLLAALRRAFGVEAHGVDPFAYASTGPEADDGDRISSLWSAHTRSGLRILSPFELGKRRLPYPNDYFDAITAQRVVAHFDGSQQALLEEVFRVLKPGGALVIDAPNPVSWKSQLKLLRGETVNRSGSGDFTLEDLGVLLRGAGFEIQTAETTTYAATADDTGVLETYLTDLGACLSAEYGATLTLPAWSEIDSMSKEKVSRFRDVLIVTTLKP